MLRLYRVLLFLLPPGFRRAYGAALADEAKACAEEEGRGWRRVRVGIHLGADLAGTVVREWGDVMRHGIRTGTGGGMMSDLRWAMRSLRRSAGYALAVVTMLGLGIGASAVAVGLADAYLVKSLPYPDGDRLLALWPSENWSSEMVDLAREGTHTLDGVAATGGALMVLDEGGEPEEVFVATATANHFDVIGVQPALGRGFVAEDGVPGATPVTVLSHRTWVERFGSDPSVVGRTIALGGDGQVGRAVIGVMPDGYLPVDGAGVAAWVPVVVDRADADYAGQYSMKAVGRMAAGFTPADALLDMRAWAPRMGEADPEWFTPERIGRADVVPLGRYVTGDRRTPVLLALAAALLVLLVACGNTANLMVARTAARERELSVRGALGASRLRTARTIFMEVAVLGTVAAIGGFGLAAGLVGSLERWWPGALPQWGMTLNLRWCAGAVGLAISAASAAGLLPTLQASRRDPARALAGGRGTSTTRSLVRTQELLSAAQLALATAGVAAMGLLGRSLLRLDSVDSGITPGHTLTFRVTAPPDAYPNDADVARFFRDVRAAIASEGGVESVGFGSRLPLSGGESETTVEPEGMGFSEGAPRPVVWQRLVTPGYLEALGARLLEGRLPTDADDRDGAPELVVINRAAARAYWPDASAVGRHFYGPDHEVWLTVAGVVADVLEQGQGGSVKPALYLPHRHQARRSMFAAVRTRAEAMELLPAVKRAVRSVSPGTPLSRVETLERVLDGGLRPTRSLTILAALAGAVTLLLGGLGTYGVVSLGVTQRLRELGVRAAMGADRGQLLRGELGGATRIVAAGLVGGLGLAWLTGRALRDVLFGVGSFDAVSFAGALSLLAGVGYLAAYLPARRASRVDPAQVMREE